jgi:hypothetical protein
VADADDTLDDLPEGSPEIVLRAPDLSPTLTARDMAEAGATVEEIARALDVSERQASLDAGPVTGAQLRRIEHMQLARAIGYRELAPHTQASQFLLAAHVPETYGRQAVAGEARIRVIVDRDWSRRAVEVSDGVIVPATLTPSTGE